jgi:hypothetical protein
MNKECTFSEYYQQFITEQTKRLVTSGIGIRKIKNALDKGDEHLNSIPLRHWDNLTFLFHCNEQLKEHGDFESLAGKVCILKETARMLADE